MKARRPCDGCGNFNAKAEKCLYSYTTVDPRTGICDRYVHREGHGLDQWVKEAPRQ
jgi:hypothetical protein